MTLSTIERAAAYLRNIPGAIQGSHGSAQTFSAAQALVIGFQLDEETALRLLAEIHNPTCSPPWSDRELRHKVRSAATRSDREPGYLLTSDDRKLVSEAARWQETTKPAPLDDASFHNVATKLLALCPLDSDDEVLRYTDARRLTIQAGRAGCGALPPIPRQAEVIEALLKTFELETLVKAGLLKKDQDDKVERRWFHCPSNRLVLPWRNSAAQIQNLQRRQIGDGKGPKYTFPSGRAPTFPFGSEFEHEGAPIAFVEGALDVLAVRQLCARAQLPVLCLGIPGVDNWRKDWAKRTKGRDVLVGLDADKAGNKHAAIVARDCLEAGARSVKRWGPREAKDWAEMVEVGT